MFHYVLYPFFLISEALKRIYWSEWKFTTMRRLKQCGKNVHLGDRCEFTPSTVCIGTDVSIGNNCCLIATRSTIYIGNKVMIAPNVTICGGNHRTNLIGKYMADVGVVEKRTEDDRDVFIEDDAWIGTNVTILTGARIGWGKCYWGGAVVTKNVPPYTIHLGVHNTYEKARFTPDEIITHEILLYESKRNVMQNHGRKHIVW